MPEEITDPPVAPPTEPQAPAQPEPPVIDPPKPAGLSDKEIQAKMAREKAEGEKAAIRKLSEELGMSIDDVKSLVKADKDRQDAEKTELDKLREELDSTKTESTTTVSKAQREAHEERIKTQLLLTGVPLPEEPEKKMEALNRLVGFVKVDVGASLEDIATDIGSLKEQFPALFEAPTVPPVSGNPPSNPSGTPRTSQLPSTTPTDVAKAMAEQANAKRGVTTKSA